MVPYNGFILSIFLVLPGSITFTDQGSACRSMEATVKVSSTTSDQGVIEIIAPLDADLKVYLLDAGTSELPVEKTLSNGQLRQVAPGQYDVILQDSRKKYCLYTQRVTVN
jgi:hypothetical protein